MRSIFMINACDHVVTIISPKRSKCHPLVLALMFCTSERYTLIGRICCGCSAHQSQGLSVLSDPAMIDELGWAADFIISS